MTMEHGLTGQLIALLFITAGMMITPLLFIALDFWAGIRKAKQRGDKIMSDKLQRTVRKLSRYYNAILAMMVLDAIQISAFIFLHLYNGWSCYTFPLFTLLSVMFVAAIEIKSIMEPADAKESRELKEVTELAKAITEHRSDPTELAKTIADYLNNQKHNEEDKA